MYTDGHRAAAIQTGSYHAYQIREEAAGKRPLHLRKRIYHLRTCRTYHLVSHSRIINSPFYFIFLQLRRAQQQRHSRIHIYYCLIFSIDDRTFQRVQGEETFIIITIIHRVTLLRPNANRRIEGRASEGVRPPQLTFLCLAHLLPSSLHIVLSTCNRRATSNGNEI